MSRGEGEERHEYDLGLLWDSAAGPGMLYKLERQFWLDLWRAPVLDAVEEDGIEVRRYGPVQAMVIAVLPEVPLLNVILGASDPGSVAEGHLAAALEWTESQEIDCRVPVRPEFQESGAAEDHLNQRGYHRTAALARFVRDASAPQFPEPPGIEIDEWTEETEGFSDYFTEGYGLERAAAAAALFDCLPGRVAWRCYVAIDAGNDDGIGAATMMQHFEVAQLGFATAKEQARRRGVHLALIRRRIRDAAASGAKLIFADTEEPVDDPDSPSPAARNLVHAGFKLASARTVWRPA